MKLASLSNFANTPKKRIQFTKWVEGGGCTRHSGQSTVALETKEPQFPVLGKLGNQSTTLSLPSNLECNIYSTVERGHFISVYN